MNHFLDVSDLNVEMRESVAFSGTGDAYRPPFWRLSTPCLFRRVKKSIAQRIEQIDDMRFLLVNDVNLLAFGELLTLEESGQAVLRG